MLNHTLAPEPNHGLVDTACAPVKPLFMYEREPNVLLMLMLVTVKFGWFTNGTLVNHILEFWSNALGLIVFPRIVM